jgi:tRNA(fMet)-specific endonuclease VapC
MSLLLDTNIILSLVKANDVSIISFINPKNEKVFISLATYAEIHSIAIQNSWGTVKKARLETICDDIGIIEMTDFLVESYVSIDTFSRRKNPNFTQYTFPTAITMGKNDLWIAATAAFLDLTLVTTDKDFKHLDQIFMDVRYIESDTLRGYFK